MDLMLCYQNEIGSVEMSGRGVLPLRVTAIDGLGLVSKEFETAVYPEYDGQHTLSSRAVARSITIAVEVCDRDAVGLLRKALQVFGAAGFLYVRNEDINRRIRCSQVSCPDVSRILKGQIASFAVQFVCDNPYFEDAEDTVIPLYQRIKMLSSPFSLPAVFGDIVLGATIKTVGAIPVEPVITVHYPSAMENAERLVLKNETTGSGIWLEYAPSEAETVVIDVKNRRITGSVGGNLIGFLSDDTFLGDFILAKGQNILTVDMGDVASGFTVECRYNNLYGEAVIV